MSAVKTLETHQEWSLAGNIYIHFLKEEVELPEAYLGLFRIFTAQGKSREALEVLERGAARTAEPRLITQLQSRYTEILMDQSIEPRKRYDVAIRAAHRGLAPKLAAKTLIRYAAPLKCHTQAATSLMDLTAFLPEQEADLLHASASLYYQSGQQKQARETLFVLLDKNPTHPGGKRLFELMCSN